ncbi:catalase-related domain-containing protein [Pedobacter mendelii]|uniref:Catalase immune-responsive domain-containing protein n=1 Tax=Pedobacter mendelii TaxID=1908240 RepID=A0ABQ2BE65_9SPHI|nr:catalase-related domain-containing protein [Pedobacter mendelii]GGI24080.1 hypothetical protein GCM10008119_10870 [Pedobacter mendelii]
MDQQAKKNTIANIVSAMGGINGVKKDEIVNRQLCHWFRADMNLGLGIVKGLDLNLDKGMEGMVNSDITEKATNN